ncbi:HAMP domain-containing histidine kinase [Candidatus Fermentibacteria bacterium]|nr:HAMP domain-containing histidine kinase [Candidatus Fermentibacteria bacterium]
MRSRLSTLDIPESLLYEPIKAITGRPWARISLVAALSLVFMFAGWLFHYRLHNTAVFSHLAYIPVVLAGIWWEKRVVLLSLLFSAEILLLHFLMPCGTPLWTAAIRAGSVLIVAAVIGELSGRIHTTQRKLERVNEMLSQMSRLQKDFLHITVHDLKAPVDAAGALLTALDSLINVECSPREQHLLARARARLDEASSFLRDFQFLSALDSEELGRQAAPTDVRAVLEKTLEECSDLASKRSQSVSVEISGEVPQVIAIARLLSEAVMNLATNAVKYTPEGGKIVLRALPGEPGTVRIEVQDSGIGIAKEDLDDLFKEFVRIRRRNPSLGNVPGIGLGLSIVKRVAELHGGTVGVESEPGKGSTFWIELPAAPAEASVPMAPGTDHVNGV